MKRGFTFVDLDWLSHAMYSVGVALMEILNDSLKQYTLPEGLALVLLRIYILGTKKAYWEGEGLNTVVACLIQYRIVEYT